jgi:hypothetical protein
MRNRRQTIESLRRLAERPGTKAEGETARRLLEAMTAGMPQPKPFNLSEFPRGTEIWYAYWCYWNCRGTVRTKPPKMIQGKWWMLIKFDHLKQARWVPVTSGKGCHISKRPFTAEETEFLHNPWV